MKFALKYPQTRIIFDDNKRDFMKSKPYISSQDFFFSTLSDDLNHQFTPLEWACFLGKLDNVKVILHPDNTVQNNPQFINAILLTIQQNHMHIFDYFINREDFQSLIQQNRDVIQNHIEQYGQRTYQQKIENILSVQHNLDTDDMIQRLISYYQTQLCSYSLEEHLQNLRDTISRHYHQSKAIYITQNQECIHLPLNWESFQLIAEQYDISTQKGMLNAYCRHPIHTAWRYLHPSHAWFANANLPEFAYEEMIWTSLRRKRWMIVLMWLAASDTELPPREHPVIKNVEKRVAYFLQHFSEIHLHIQDPSLHLLHAIIGHPHIQMMTSQTLIQEQKNFVLNLLFKRFSETPTEQLISATKQEFMLSPMEYEQFSNLMYKKWGNHWALNSTLIHESNVRLRVIHQEYPELIEQVLELHAHTRQLNLQHRFFLEDESCEKQVKSAGECAI